RQGQGAVGSGRRHLPEDLLPVGRVRGGRQGAVACEGDAEVAAPAGVGGDGGTVGEGDDLRRGVRSGRVEDREGAGAGADDLPADGGSGRVGDAGDHGGG